MTTPLLISLLFVAINSIITTAC